MRKSEGALKMLEITYVTTNDHKFSVARNFFESAGLLGRVSLVRKNEETPEIQANSVEDVARESAAWISRRVGCAVVVGDAGLAVASLEGFPGPYMKYINSTLSVGDFLNLMKGKDSRSATFVDCLAYFDPDRNECEVFVSRTEGSIAENPSNQPGSTVDRLFVPDGWTIPLADIPTHERVKVWNVDRWQELVDYLALNH